MNPRRFLLFASFPLLLLACATPLLMLIHIASAALQPASPGRVALSDGRVLLGQILPQDGFERDAGTVRVLLGNGEPGPAARSFPSASVLSVSADASVWVLERDDGPTLFGVPLSVAGPGWSFDSPESVSNAMVHLPARLRKERTRLAEEIRTSSGDSSRFRELSQGWERWLARDDATRLLLDLGGGQMATIRVSGIAAAWPSGRAVTSDFLRRVRLFLLTAPGAWGGGGILPAMESVFLLALMAGLFSGVFGLSAALWIQSRAPGEVWLERGKSLVSALAGIPGVVWGVAGYGLLVHGLGPVLDSLGGGTLWSAGGLLWSGATLGALASPIVMALAMEELDRIPSRWKEIAWTCGATRLQVFLRVVLPSAWKGLFAAVLSGMARAAGETAPLLLTGAVHAFGGLSLGGGGAVSKLAGGFLHPGVLALDSPWSGGDLERGQPRVALMLLLLAAVCIGLDLAASRLRRRRLPVEDGI